MNYRNHAKGSFSRVLLHKIHFVGEPRLLPTGEAARAVGVSARTLQRWVREGLVKPTQLTAGGHHRWLVDDLKAQIRALNQEPDA